MSCHISELANCLEQANVPYWDIQHIHTTQGVMKRLISDDMLYMAWWHVMRTWSECLLKTVRHAISWGISKVEETFLKRVPLWGLGSFFWPLERSRHQVSWALLVGWGLCWSLGLLCWGGHDIWCRELLEWSLGLIFGDWRGHDIWCCELLEWSLGLIFGDWRGHDIWCREELG